MRSRLEAPQYNPGTPSPLLTVDTNGDTGWESEAKVILATDYDLYYNQ